MKTVINVNWHSHFLLYLIMNPVLDDKYSGTEAVIRERYLSCCDTSWSAPSFLATEFILQHDGKVHFVHCVAAYEVLNTSNAVYGGGAT